MQSNNVILSTGRTTLDMTVCNSCTLCDFLSSNSFTFLHCRPPLPQTLIGDFCDKVPSAMFTTNPCRIQYCTQEIVIFREDIVTKMCRNCVRFPSDGNIPNHVCRHFPCNVHCTSFWKSDQIPFWMSSFYWNNAHFDVTKIACRAEICEKKITFPSEKLAKVESIKGFKCTYIIKAVVL